MKFWHKIKEIMTRPKNPRIRALENKNAKLTDLVTVLQERLSKYESVIKLETSEEKEIEAEEYVEPDMNYTEFQFAIKENGEYLAIQTKPEFKTYKLGDNAIRAEFMVKKLLAHGDILPKKSK